MNRPDSSTSPRRSFSSGIRGSYCALTSTSGIIGTSTSPGEMAEDQPGRDEHDGGDHSVVNPTEFIVYPLVAGSDTPADAREQEAPDRRPREREQRVDAEGRAEDPGRYRDEGADDRCQAADEHGRVAATLEPGLRAREVLGGEMQPAPTSFDQRPSSVCADPPADDRADEVAERPGEGGGDEPPEVRGDRVSE